MKNSIQTAVIWVFLLFVTAASLTGYIKEQSKSKRLLYNLVAARDSAKTFTTKDGHQASKLVAQNLTASEFKKVNPETVEKLKNLDIRPGQVESYTEAKQILSAEVPVNIHDTNRIENTDTIKMKVLEYQDKWISISGVIDPEPAKIKVVATDTIFTAIYKGERRHPWAWIFSKRQYTAAATNRSPYIKINVIQSGVIKK